MLSKNQRAFLLIEISRMILEEKIFEYVKKQGNKEACGFIENKIFYPVPNMAANPKETFFIAPKDYRPQANILVHSHPNNEPFLSGADRLSQSQTGLDFWLVTQGKIKKFRHCPLLKGRVFEYGKYDCGAIIEDAYMLMGIFQEQVVRNELHTDEKRAILPTNLLKRGFRQIANQHDGISAIQAGDVVLTSMQGVANHAGLYLGDGKILHHPLNGLSRVETFGGYWIKGFHSIWRHHNFKPFMLEAVFNDLNAGINND